MRKFTNKYYYSKINTTPQALQYGIIIFWTLWSALVFAADFVNFLQKIHIMSDSVHFTSNNYLLVEKSLSTYGLHSFILCITIYAIINLGAFLVTCIFGLACFTIGKNYNNFIKSANVAFIASFVIDAFFVLCDEIFVQYSMEHDHLIRFGIKFITFIVFNIKYNTAEPSPK